MASRKSVPKGYRMEEYPLPHDFKYYAKFGLESAVANFATIFPILKYTDEAGSVETIEVNPRNTNFAEEGGALINPGSIVPRISIKMDAFINETAIAEGVRRCKFFWMPIYTAFVEPMEAYDEKTSTTIESILKLQTDNTTQKTSPLYNGVDLKGGDDYPLSLVNATETFTTAKLTTDLNLEGVAWTDTDQDTFWDAKNYYTNKSMLNKVTGKMQLGQMTDRFDYHYYSNNFAHPTVKRANPFMFCGIFLWFPQSGSEYQNILSSEITDIPHVDFRLRIKFDEWNPQFDQTPI